MHDVDQIKPDGKLKDSNYFVQRGTSPLERWYAGIPNGCTAWSSAAFNNSYLNAEPFVVADAKRVVDQISINVTIQHPSGSARLGIYTNHPNPQVLYPDQLLYDSGAVSLTSTGVKTVKLRLTLPGKRLYWAGLQAPDAGSPPTPAYLQTQPNEGLYPIFGLDSSIPTTPYILYFFSRSYAPLPFKFPAGATLDTAHSYAAALRFLE